MKRGYFRHGRQDPATVPFPPGAYSVLASSTFAFTVCFAAWMMFAVLGIPIKEQLG